MKINGKIMLVLSMVLLLTFMTGSTAYDVDALDSNQIIQEDCTVNSTILETASDDSINENSNGKSTLEPDEKLAENNDNKFIDNNEFNSMENNECYPIENNESYTMDDNKGSDTSLKEYENDEMKNFDGIVISDDSYSCGPASLATVLNKLGMNLTLKEVSQFTETTQENGTSMLSLINASRHFGFDAAGVMISTCNLKENYIVHMNIDGNEHWTVFKNITDDHVFLMDPNEGNINFTLDEFNSHFTGNAIIIFNEADNFIQEELESNNITILSDEDSCEIFGKRMVKRVVGYKTVRKYGFIPHYGWKLMPVVSKGQVHFSQWKYVKGVYYTLGWYTTKEPIYKTYYISDEALTSAPLKNVKKTTKTLKKSSKSKKLQASKKAKKKTAKKSVKKSTKKNKK